MKSVKKEDKLTNILKEFVVFIENNKMPLDKETSIPNTMNAIHSIETEESKIARIEEVILKTFHSFDLVDILNKWEQCEKVNKRVPLLNSALAMYLQKNYFGAIQVFLAQFEGILADEIIRRNPGNDFASQELLRIVAEEILGEQQINYLYGIFNHENELIVVLDRKSILYGDEFNYGIRINTLNCIFMIDNLIEKIINNEKVELPS